MNISVRSTLFMGSILLLGVSVLLPGHRGEAAPPAPTLEGKPIEELAELFSRFPVGSGFNLSPKGDRFFAYMPNKGERGLIFMETASLDAGFKEGRFLKPGQRFEISSPFWIDNNLIGFDTAMWDDKNIGFQIVPFEQEKRFLDRFIWSHIKERKIRNPFLGMPRQKGTFFTFQWDLRQDPAKEYPSLARLHINEKLRINKETIWYNPGYFEYWYVRGDQPFAVEIDEEVYTMDFDILLDDELPEKEELMELLRPLELPGDLTSLRVDDIELLKVEGEGDTVGLQLYDFRSGETIGAPLMVEGYDISAWRSTFTYRSGDQIAGVMYHTGKPQLKYIDENLGRVMKALENAFQEGIPYLEGLDANNRYIYYGILSDRQDTVYARFDLQTSENKILYSTRPWLSEYALPPMEPITFKNRDGQTIHGYLTLPESFEKGDPVPLVVLSHGGPWVRDTWGFNEEVHFYAALGYAVLQINYRGSVGFGKTYGLDESLIEISEQSPKDVIDGTKWAIAEGYADPKAIAFTGGSYGAFLSMAAAAMEPDLASCAIGFAGVYDLTLMKDEDLGEEKLFAKRLYEEYEENADRYRDLSPANQAASIKAPVLIIHGGKDHRVSYEQAEVMAKELRKNGGDVELVRKWYLMHGFGREKHKREYYELVGNFLKKHLGR